MRQPRAAKQSKEDRARGWRQTWVALSVFCGLLCVGPPGALAAKPSAAQAATASAVRWIQRARKAYARGVWGDVRKALRQAERVLEKKRALPAHTAANLTLWLTLLWSKYHRMQALLPPILGASAFETKAQVKGHQKQLSQALVHLQKGLSYLTQYNILFRQVTKRMQAKEAIALVNTRSQEGILRNRVSIVRLRLMWLKRLLQGWRGKKGKARAGTSQDPKTRQHLKKIRSMQLTLQKQLRQQALAFQRSERVYQHFLQDLARRKRGGAVLSWIGIGCLAVGGAVGIAGVVFHVESEAWAIPDERKKLSPGDSRVAKNAGTGLLIGAGSLVALGATLWLVGRFLTPSKRAAYQGVYKSHKHYLDWEDKVPRDTTPATHAPPMAQRTLDQRSVRLFDSGAAF